MNISERDKSFILNNSGSLCFIKNGKLEYKSDILISYADNEKSVHVYGVQGGRGSNRRGPDQKNQAARGISRVLF